MKVKFYNGRKLVCTVVCNSINGAINLVDSMDIEWTRYKIVGGTK